MQVADTIIHLSQWGHFRTNNRNWEVEKKFSAYNLGGSHHIRASVHSVDVLRYNISERSWACIVYFPCTWGGMELRTKQEFPSSTLRTSTLFIRGFLQAFKVIWEKAVEIGQSYSCACKYHEVKKEQEKVWFWKQSG